MLCVAAAFLVPAMPQPLAYHRFADRQSVFGIPNFFDVVSNVGFLVAGIAGLVVVFNGRTHFEFANERWPWAVFFLGVLLTAFGSSYYHLAPDNDRLFWDRLPMTIAFMALVSSQVVDRQCRRASRCDPDARRRRCIRHLLAVDGAEGPATSCLMEFAGYAVVVLLLLAILVPSRYTRGSDLFRIFAWYAMRSKRSMSRSTRSLIS